MSQLAREHPEATTEQLNGYAALALGRIRCGVCGARYTVKAVDGVRDTRGAMQQACPNCGDHGGLQVDV